MKAYGYIRVSTDDQKENGKSLDAQRELIERWFHYQLAGKGYEWGGIVEEEPVTASRPLCERPRGKLLNAALERGDYVIFAKLDRGFRDTRDLLATNDAWLGRGVYFRFLDLDVDSRTAAGKLILTVMGAVAEFERGRMIERLKQVHAYQRSMGLVGYGNAAIGWMVKKTVRGRELVPNDEERGIALRCLEWYEDRWTVTQIYQHLKEMNVGRPRTATTRSHWYGRTAVWNLIMAARYDFPQEGTRFLAGEARKEAEKNGKHKHKEGGNGT